MSSLPVNLYRAEQCRELDRLAIGTHGISGNILMERAGEAAFDALREAWPAARRVVVLCGIGNNGGDGFVLARLAHERGLEVDVYQIGDAERIRGDALAARQRLMGVDVTPRQWSGQPLEGADVLVDALLGTGLGGEVREPFRGAIEAANASGAPILALDIPSGLDADTGMPHGAAIRAAETITFIGLKPGMLTARGPDYCGHIRFDDLKLPEELYAQVPPAARRLVSGELRRALKPRPRSAHKGEFGHVLLVGGNQGMNGAVRLAGEAALRTGAGLVSIATRRDHAPLISACRPELMSHGIESAEALKQLSARATVIAVGPGLGQDDWAREMIAIAVARKLPVVIDADALNLLVHIPLQRPDWVLTPHPGEAARLLDTDTASVMADRFAAARELSERFSATVVLKGAGTIVQPPEALPGVCTAGNPGMATAGMGDVLTGVIAALSAQGLPLPQAAALGVCLHAEAGDLAVRGIGERGLVAGDMMAPLRRLANEEDD